MTPATHFKQWLLSVAILVVVTLVTMFLQTYGFPPPTKEQHYHHKRLERQIQLQHQKNITAQKHVTAKEQDDYSQTIAKPRPEIAAVTTPRKPSLLLEADEIPIPSHPAELSLVPLFTASNDTDSLHSHFTKIWTEPDGRALVRVLASNVGKFKRSAKCSTPRLWIVMHGAYRTFHYSKHGLVAWAQQAVGDCWFIAMALHNEVEIKSRILNDTAAATMFASPNEQKDFKIRPWKFIARRDYDAMMAGRTLKQVLDQVRSIRVLCTMLLKLPRQCVWTCRMLTILVAG
jgi:hypothetical protein